MAKYYTVEVPVVLKLMVGVEAESEQEAIEKVFNGDISITAEDGENKFEYIDYEWDMYTKVTEGNVYYPDINEPSAEFDYEDEEG